MAGRTEERVAAALPKLYALCPLHEFPAWALGVVTEAIGADKGVYTEIDPATGDFRVLVSPEPPELRGLDEARRMHMHQHPVLNHFLRVPDHRARRISDFVTRAEFHRLDLYGEFFAVLGVEDQLTVRVARTAAASVDRGGRLFDEGDRHLLDALRPHLVAARKNAERFTSALTRNDRPDEAAAVERLSDRQRQVLALVSAGRTNAEIALALDLSIGTVRKHIEHILRRLGVSTRTAAAATFIHASRPPATSWSATVPALLRYHA